MTDRTITNNPLLVADGMPRFDEIEPPHVVPAVEQLLANAEDRIAQIEADIEPTWEATLGALESLDRPFEFGWQPISHLFGVLNSDELRTAYETVLPDVVAFGLRVNQSEPLYQAIKKLRGSADWSSLAPAQQRIVDRRLLQAELAGIGLSGEKRERFNEIVKRLSQLSTEFSNHVLDATKAYSLTITDPDDTAGWPDTLRQMAAHSDNEQRHNEQRHNEQKDDAEPEATAENGPWRITLEIPSYLPFMKHCRNRELREEVYRAYMTRASEGEYDNQPLCREMLALRKEKAHLLGYASHAEVSLAEKMAEDVEQVHVMLERLRVASRGSAEADLQEIHEMAIAGGQSEALMHWDVAFWSERLREHKFDFTDEQLRPYFPHERVLEGLFGLVNRLFGIHVQPADGKAPVWHEDVRYFEITDDQQQVIAAFYYDPYSRPENKRPGAWMDECLNRRMLADRLQVPVAHLVCNCTPPLGETPALMTFREVETLFHEFGHGLQHMLTTVDFPDAAGINGVEWDAVELPSQFMENWCYHRPTVLGMTGHYQTGEPLPEELFEKICAARTFQAGLIFLRQLTFGITDLELHSVFDPSGEESIFDVQRRIMERTSVLPMLEEDRFLCAFQHIFSGGYSAGYYSYKWAEVLSSDAFSAFEDAGLEDDDRVQQTGRRFRETVLSQGGSRHPMDIFREFRGREPSPEPLLRHNGLLDEAT